jgi:hypothetical protein
MRFVRPAAWSAAVLVFAGVAWLVFVDSLSPQEWLLGAVCALFCTFASLLTWKAMDLSIAIVPSELMEIWRVPVSVAVDALTLIAVLARDLFGIARAASHFRAAPFHNVRGRRGRLRRVLVTIYSSISPNSIVIGIDREQHLLVFHQLVPKPIPKLMRRLGAHP